jgi:Ca-activated chloride channel family protein
MAHFDPNDERLTAYILGDDSLSAADRAAVAELLSTNADAQRFADELRAAASLAGAELAAEAVPALASTAGIESAVRRELARPKNGSWLFRSQWLVAAGLVVGLGLYFGPRIQQNGTRELAKTDAMPSPKVMAKSPAPKGFAAPFGNDQFKGGKDDDEVAAAATRPNPDKAWRQNDDGSTPAAEAAPTRAGSASGGLAAGADRGRVANENESAERVERDSNALRSGTSAKPMQNAMNAGASAGGVPAPQEEAARGGKVAEKNPDRPMKEGEKLSQESAGARGPAPAKPLGTQGRGAQGVDLYDVQQQGQSVKTREEMNLYVDAAQPRYQKNPSEFDIAKRGGMPAQQPARQDAGGAKPSDVPANLGLKPAINAPALHPTDTEAKVAESKVELKAHDPMAAVKLDMLADGAEPEFRFREADVQRRLEDQVRAKNVRGFGLMRQGFNREVYPVLKENDFLRVNEQNQLSTFSIDVDTASYALVRRFLTQESLPPPGAVRLEEMVNYFRYDYEGPKGETPFAAHLEIAECPWNPEHRLARIALKGREIDRNKRPPSNLVFLIDVSGSMSDHNKLPLVKESLKLLVNELGENDRVAIAVYASGSGLLLDSTNGGKKAEIVYAIDNLRSGGSTNGAAGIKAAYDAAVKGFIKGGTNRVILCTDGDFNVGVTSDDELVQLITEKAKTGVFLSCLAVGEGNVQDAKMLQLANKGNGNYGYLDSIQEARKILVEQMSGTLVTIAKDVKIQVDFNPAKVAGYRLLGYEKRMLKAEDFKNDKKDAGEIGAGHTITALYELVPAGKTVPGPAVDPSEFAAKRPAEPSKFESDKPAKSDDELAKAVFRVRMRYKQPDGKDSTEIRFTAIDEGKSYVKASEDFRFAAAVASFAMILRDSQFKGNANLAAIHELASAAKGPDPGGYRAEFIKLVEKARVLKK